MPAPEPALVVIACPHCGTRYQIAYETIGRKGRTVQCAHCGRSWEAHAEPPPASAPAAIPVPDAPPSEHKDKDFGELAEEMLDQKFVIEEQRHRARREAAARAESDAKLAKVRAKADQEALAAQAETSARGEAEERAAAIARATAATVAAGPGADGEARRRSAEHQRTLDEIKAAVGGESPGVEKLDPAARKRQQLEFSKRQKSLRNRLPMARVRRAARYAVLTLLVVVVGGGIALRGPIVMQFPQLAGLYAGAGLSVNVIGLEFRHVHTLLSLQQDTEVLQVDGDIASVAGHEVEVPEVIVTLIGSKGQSLYEWSVVPKATELEPGESIGFTTQLSKPPDGAKDVKLTFANGRIQSRTADTDAAPDGPVTDDNSGPAAIPAAKPMDGPITFATPPTTGKDDGSNPAR